MRSGMSEFRMSAEHAIYVFSAILFNAVIVIFSLTQNRNGVVVKMPKTPYISAVCADFRLTDLTAKT